MVEIRNVSLEPPKHLNQSFIAAQAIALKTLNKIIGITSLLGIGGLTMFCPPNLKQYVPQAAGAIGIIAYAIGNEKTGTAIINERLRHGNVFDPTKKIGADTAEEASWTAKLDKESADRFKGLQPVIEGGMDILQLPIVQEQMQKAIAEALATKEKESSTRNIPQEPEVKENRITFGDRFRATQENKISEPTMSTSTQPDQVI